MLQETLHKRQRRRVKKRKFKLTDYTCLTDEELIKCGARAEKSDTQRAANPFTRRQARLWTYGWNKQHRECTGCGRCHNVGTLQMPSSYLVYLRACQQYEKELGTAFFKEPNAMTFEDLILEANAREAAAKAKAEAIEREIKKEKEKNEYSTTRA
jgi:ferredoxin